MSILNFCLESYGSEYSCHNKEDYIDKYGSIPHQKICFHHLPTRGRVGIKLGLELASVFPEEERMTQHSSIGISLSF